jgi:antitoxin ParD1/3/4
MNISMPEPMRAFVEAQAAAENYSTSEYVRHLIRQDEQHKVNHRRQLMSQLLAISEAQIARGDVSTITLDQLFANVPIKNRATKKKPK